MSFSWTTFALQAVNFLILIWLLKRFLFKPVAAMVAQRKAEIARAQTEAEKARQAADKARADFEKRQAESEAQRREVIEQARREIADERAKMLESARAEIERQKVEALKQLHAEQEQAARELAESSARLAVRLASRLIEQVAAPRLDEIFLERLTQHLDGLSPAERAGMLDQFGRYGQDLVITTAHPMDPAAQEKWRAALSTRFAGNHQIVFAVNKDLIAGAELKFPHAVLHFNWRHAMTEAERELIQNGQPG